MREILRPLYDSYRYMSSNAMQLMRIVLLLLLFQFLSPAFIPVTGQGFDPEGQQSLSLHLEHNAIPVPLILKEKEENEFEKNITSLVLTQLIDFTDHSQALTEFHELKANSTPFQGHHNHKLPLFTLFCTYII